MCTGYRVLQGHVFSSGEGQTLGAVVVHHLWDTRKHTAALVQRVTTFFGLCYNNVHTNLAGSADTRQRGMNQGDFTSPTSTLKYFVTLFLISKTHTQIQMCDKS